MSLMDDMLVGAVKLELTKDSKCDIFLDKTLVVEGLRVLGSRQMHIGCGCLGAERIRIVIESKHIVKVKLVQVLGCKNRATVDEDDEPSRDYLNALILNI